VGRFAVAETWRADDPAASPPREAAETLIVWRRDGEVFHRPAEADEALWFPRLAPERGRRQVPGGVARSWPRRAAWPARPRARSSCSPAGRARV
jgi:hypothetical protein